LLVDSHRYQRVKSILLAALDVPASERPAYVASACQDDEALRAEVESLLAYEAGDDFLEPVLDRVVSDPLGAVDSAASDVDAIVGQTILQYRVIERLQAGGMGVVYLADDLRLGRLVALKFLKPELVFDQQAKSRFSREATAVASLAHPNICTLYGVEETEDGQVFMAMAYYQGETLRDALLRGPLPVAACVDIGRQIGNGLAAAHAEGIVHRDVKPANVMLVEGAVKILDFGIAKLTDGTSLTAHGTTLGTPDYMSPEQARGRSADHRTDIWSLGVVLYEMLTGRRPFAIEELFLPDAEASAVAPPLLPEGREELPSALEDAVRRALWHDPNLRYRTMREFVRTLDRIAAGQERRTRITVMPFVHQQGGIDSPLADVLTEGVIDALSAAGGCIVHRASRSAGRGGAVLRGTTAEGSGTVTVTISLADGATGDVIAATKARERASMVPKIVTEIARDVTGALGVRLTAEEERQMAYRSRADASAYDAHLRGRCALLQESVEGAAAAWSHFERALAVSPHAMGPLMHAALVEACVVRLEQGGEAPEEIAGRARRELKTALRLDASAPEVQFAAAEMAFRVDWSPVIAESRLRCVLAARPGHTRAAVRLAECLAATGSALDAAEIAKDVVRSGGSSNGTLLRAGRILHVARHYADAAAVFEDVLRTAPQAAVARFDLALTLAKGHDRERARAECDRALASHEGRAIAAAAAANAAKARGAVARHETFRSVLNRLHQRTPVPACCFALIDASFGNTGRPIEYLEGFDAALGLTKFLGFAPVGGSLTGLVSAVGLIAYLGLDPAFDCLYTAASFQRLSDFG